MFDFGHSATNCCFNNIMMVHFIQGTKPSDDEVSKLLTARAEMDLKYLTQKLAETVDKNCSATKQLIAFLKKLWCKEDNDSLWMTTDVLLKCGIDVPVVLVDRDVNTGFEKEDNRLAWEFQVLSKREIEQTIAMFETIKKHDMTEKQGKQEQKTD